MMESDNNLKIPKDQRTNPFDYEPHFFAKAGVDDPADRCEFRMIDIPNMHIIEKGSVNNKLFEALANLDIKNELFS